MRWKAKLALGVIIMTALISTSITDGYSSVDIVGELNVIALESQAAPDEIGGIYSEIHAGAVADSGEVAFSVSLTDSATRSAMLLKSGGITRVLLREGEAAPGGGSYKAFRQLDVTLVRTEVGDEPFILFRAELDGGSAPEGVFLRAYGRVEPIALAGGESPRNYTYASFDQLTIANTGVGSADFRLAFVANMKEGKKSIIVKPSYQEALEMLTTGDRLEKGKVEDFVISQMGISLSCVAQMRDAKKKRYKEVIIVHNGFIASGNSLREGVRFPGLGKVKSIASPPTINAQEGYAAIEFRDGISALATRSLFGTSGVFVKSGDAAPGLPGEIIQTFGPPVSNGYSVSPFGMVSVVTLKSGRPALWAGVFTHQVPLTGEAKLILIEDLTPDSEGVPVLHSFSPMKLTNKGHLLLRGVTSDGTADRKGLLLMTGLFNESSE